MQSYLRDITLAGGHYNVYGHQGKQVRDNIHSFDVARFAERFFAAPRCAEVYNIGGGRANSCSILEAFERVEELTRRPMKWVYINKPREGDHICYISNLNKLRKHYPGWDVTKTLDDIFVELVNAWKTRGNWPRVGHEVAV